MTSEKAKRVGVKDVAILPGAGPALARQSGNERGVK
jgi:hypothetical protein